MNPSRPNHSVLRCHPEDCGIVFRPGPPPVAKHGRRSKDVRPSGVVVYSMVFDPGHGHERLASTILCGGRDDLARGLRAWRRHIYAKTEAQERARFAPMLGQGLVLNDGRHL